MLKSAWEIALEKHGQHEQLTHITREYLDHVAMLEECWSAIRPSAAPAAAAEPAELRRAA